MTGAGLKDLRRIQNEIRELIQDVTRLQNRIRRFYEFDEDVLDQDAHGWLIEGTNRVGMIRADMQSTIDVIEEAYKAEKKLMEFEGLLNKEDHDEEEPREA